MIHDSFEDYMAKLEEVLNICHKNDLQIHVEKIFIAAQKFNYLGYHLTLFRIKLQEKKVKAILNIDRPKMTQKLYCFISFIQYYWDMFRRHSDILHPFTLATSNKIKKIFMDE